MKKLLFITALLLSSCVAHAAYLPGSSQYMDVETGLQTNILGADGAPRSMTYETAIALGQVAAHSTYRGFGERTAVTTATGGNDIWQGTSITLPIPNQTTGEQMTVVSTSASDGVAGVGCLTLDVHDLNAAGTEVNENVTMSGVTPVNTTRTDWRFIQAIHCGSVGTTGYTVGNGRSVGSGKFRRMV